VFDPFLGSGTVAVVAKMLGRHYLGFEIVPEYYEFARERIAKVQMSLFKWLNGEKFGGVENLFSGYC